jgi:hypothetical protein
MRTLIWCYYVGISTLVRDAFSYRCSYSETRGHDYCNGLHSDIRLDKNTWKDWHFDLDTDNHIIILISVDWSHIHVLHSKKLHALWLVHLMVCYILCTNSVWFSFSAMYNILRWNIITRATTTFKLVNWEDNIQLTESSAQNSAFRSLDSLHTFFQMTDLCIHLGIVNCFCGCLNFLRETKNLSTPFVISKPKEVESLFQCYFWIEGVMVKVTEWGWVHPISACMRFFSPPFGSLVSGSQTLFKNHHMYIEHYENYVNCRFSSIKHKEAWGL